MARVILVLRFENVEDAGKQLLSYVETAELIVLKKIEGNVYICHAFFGWKRISFKSATWMNVYLPDKECIDKLRNYFSVRSHVSSQRRDKTLGNCLPFYSIRSIDRMRNSKLSVPFFFSV